MNYVKKIFYFAVSTAFLALLSGCTVAPAPASAIAAAANTPCMQEGVSAPFWVCKPEVADAYTGLGVAQINGVDKTEAIQTALYNGRAEIAKQIQSQVREKLDNFARTPEGSNKENVDNLYTSIAREVKPSDIYLQEKLQSWTTPSGKIYIHAIASKSSFETALKKAVQLSCVNDKVIWLAFSSNQSIPNLEKEFDVVIPNQQSVRVAEMFKVESVSDTIVGRNKKR